ncbi:MAG: hypothetical protein M2R45_02042 [Verrucomicrobia subdivision 3 bacterium]|nr:hypothetical protein [Limisphaerales bacterium]MCS1414862.1 hypothetical protein [Limisphaerales bacterium]
MKSRGVNRAAGAPDRELPVGHPRSLTSFSLEVGASPLRFAEAPGRWAENQATDPGLVELTDPKAILRPPQTSRRQTGSRGHRPNAKRKPQH